MAPATKAKQKVSKQVDETPETRRLARQAANDELMERVKSLREDDSKKWGEIAEELEVSVGKVMFLYECSKVKPKDRIKYEDDDDLAKQIVAARKEGQAWGTIMARAQIGEGKARSLYTQATGEDTKGLRVGKGGRPAANGNGKSSAAAKKTSAKVEKAKAPTPKHISEMTIAELRERLVGKVITIGGRGGKKVEKIPVTKITKLVNGEMHFASDKGSRVVNLDDITKASR